MDLEELRLQHVKQSELNKDLSRRLEQAEQELKSARQYRESAVETQRLANLETQAISELQGKCKVGLERQLLTLLKAEGLLIENKETNKLEFRTDDNWNNSGHIADRIGGVIETKFPHFQPHFSLPENEPSKGEWFGGNDLLPKTPQEIRQACAQIDVVYKEQERIRYEAAKQLASAVGNHSQELMNRESERSNQPRLNKRQLMERLITEQKRLP